MFDNNLYIQYNKAFWTVDLLLAVIEVAVKSEAHILIHEVLIKGTCNKIRPDRNVDASSNSIVKTTAMLVL